MCANYKPSRRELFHVKNFIERHGENQDVWPTDLAPYVRHDGGQPIVELGRFGLLPHFAKDLTFCRNTYNARSETVAEKPSFKLAWRKSQFCLIPAEHFYEPCYETGKPVRWKIAMADGSDFSIAGLWTQWKDGAGKVESSFTMLTLNANAHPLMNRLHKPTDEKRMPYLVRPEDRDTWLTATPEVARAMIEPFPAEMMVAEPAPLLPRKKKVASEP